MMDLGQKAPILGWALCRYYHGILVKFRMGLKFQYIIGSLVFAICLMHLESPCQPYRGLYVNGFDEIVGQSSKEEELLSWASNNSINSLSLYDLRTVLADSAGRRVLANFIGRARQYGISRMVAVTSGQWVVDNLIMPYQMSCTNDSTRFDAINIENEWWVGRDRFSVYRKDMQSIDFKGMTNETYLGWFSKGKRALAQAAYIIAISDLVSIHAYQEIPSKSYVEERLAMLNDAAINAYITMPVVLIFSMEARFSGELSRNRSYDEIYAQLMSAIDPDEFANLQFVGWKIFAYQQAKQYRN